MIKKSGLIFFFIFLVGHVISQPVSTLVMNDQLHPALSAQLHGFVGRKLDSSYENRILAQDVDRLISPSQNRTETSCWQTEFWGKWFTSAVLTYRYRPEAQLKKILDKAIDGLPATQTPDGYIGNYADNKHLEAWDIRGRKYCMLGLLAYYDLTKEQKALKAAGKVADHLINELKGCNILIVKMGRHRDMAASSILGPICLLYSRTGDKRYLEFAEEIVRQWETADGPQLISKADTDVSKRFPIPKDDWYGWEQGQKSHEMMSCHEGLLELYRLTGNIKYKEAVEKTWQNILDTEINVVGSDATMECWFGGKKLQALPILHYQETWITITWIKLCQQLLRLTGEAKYSDAIEQAYYNALLVAMKPDGSDWAQYTPLSGERMKGNIHCSMDLNCCVANGPRGLFIFPLTAIMAARDGLQSNFFAEGTYTLQTPEKQKVELVQKTDYPVSGKICLTDRLQKPERMSLRIRIPQWSSEMTMMINREPLKGISRGEYVNIERNWNPDDKIELNLDICGRVLRLGNLPENLSIVRGPVVLASDTRLAAPAIESIIKPLADKGGFLKLEPIEQNNPEIWMEFNASFLPESNIENIPAISVILCDYSSA